MQMEFTPYQDYQSIAAIINDNSETMNFVGMDITWSSVNPDPFTTPTLLLIMDLHFIHKISGETNLPIDAYRSVMSAPLI